MSFILSLFSLQDDGWLEVWYNEKLVWEGKDVNKPFPTIGGFGVELYLGKGCEGRWDIGRRKHSNKSRKSGNRSKNSKSGGGK